ncbi:flagellar hook-length control protein FliK [Paeniglutamicibacter sp. R2-26]|uniref:flagellar hook-length control protein FliK n=1 Tax=Paeniglutamicibacter sp. R2-26 TaxID=3144417 RepID=UPI003EE7D8AB
MIPVIQGAPPAAHPAQPAKAGAGDSGGAFGGLLAALLPAGPGTAGAPEGTGTDNGSAGQEPAATSEALGALPLPEGSVLPLPTGALPDASAGGPARPEAGDASAVPATAPAAASAIFPSSGTSGEPVPAAPATGAPDVAAVAPGPGVAGFGIPGSGPSPHAEPVVASALASTVPGDGVSAGTAGTGTGTVTPAAGTESAGMESAGSGSDDAQGAMGFDGTLPAAAFEVAATEPRQEQPSVAPGTSAGSGAPTPPAPAPALSAQAMPMQVLPQAVAGPRQEPLAGVSAVSVGSAPAVGNVLSGEAPTLPLNRQLAGPIASLATGPHGERTLSVNVAPEALGPVTVKAHLGHDGLRVELTAPTEAGREALRAMLPELRRDLAATGAGTVSIGTGAGAGQEAGTGPGAGTHPGGGQGPAGGDQRFGGQSPLPGRPRAEAAPQPPTPASPPEHASSHLDVMA